eukprot:INCI14114.1.p1 GENE.INCI14114.1~~INCI14114.1.p1  ORF type:complete len:410 (+),score=68.72 INCI14114.1:57-1286(+)
MLARVPLWARAVGGPRVRLLRSWKSTLSRRASRKTRVVSMAVGKGGSGGKEIINFLDAHGVTWWDGGTLSDQMTATRKERLDAELRKLGIDSGEFAKYDVANLSHHAEVDSSTNKESAKPDMMPVVRTYEHFIWPRENALSQAISDSVSEQRVAQAAARTARQIEMLIRKAHVDADEKFRNLDVNRTVSGRGGTHDRDSKSNRVSNNTDSICSSDAYSVVLILDNVRSAFNTGNILRSAECVGTAAVVHCGITPRADHPDVAKAAMGAQLTIPHVAYTESSTRVVKELKAAGFAIVSLETHADAVPYTKIDFAALAKKVVPPKQTPMPPEADGKQRRQRQKPAVGGQGLALVVGNEVYGVVHNILEMSDAIAVVPCVGTKNSLNVSALTPVVLFEVRRQLEEAAAANNA